jgi:glycosyltransferase involved in cell wall biosynthesis
MNSKVKILHVIDSGGLYGAEMVLLALAAEQKRAGHTPCIASIGERGDYEKPIESEAKKRGIEVKTFRMRNGLNIFGAINIVRYALENGFDLFHSHGYKGDILLGILPSFVRRIPLVCTLHGWTSSGSLGKMRLYEWADSLCLRRADAVCLVSESMRTIRALNAIKPTCIHVIPNGFPDLDTSVTAPDDEISRFCREGFTIASIGRLSKEKAYDVLIEAFALVHEEKPDVRLLIVGEGPERDRLEGLIRKKGLESHVLLPGYREMPWRYLTECKAFVLSSLTEGLPVALLEAMLVGIPVIATMVGGIPHIITHGKTGFLVPPGDPIPLSKIINDLRMCRDATDVMIQDAQELVLERYSCRRMAMNYDAVYMKIVS